jgi:hypothetical protein
MAPKNLEVIAEKKGVTWEVVPEAVSEADRLNGISWKGVVVARSAARRNHLSRATRTVGDSIVLYTDFDVPTGRYPAGWGDWYQERNHWRYSFVRRHDAWEVDLERWEIPKAYHLCSLIACSEIPQ